MSSYLQKIFTVPFSGLALVVWGYIVFAYAVAPGNPTWHGDLPDPDDYTYLTQTLDWIGGQGWFDTFQHRMNGSIDGSGGVVIPYTRFVQVPIAGLILLIHSLSSCAWRDAALAASYGLPLFYLGLLFVVLRRLAARFAAPAWAGLSCFIALFMPALLFKFAPGQVDHHGLEVILTLVAVGLVIETFREPENWCKAALAGVTLAFALAIALETLPWLAVISIFMGVWATLRGKSARLSILAFAGGLFLASVIFLLLEKPSQNWFVPDILAYSITYNELTGGIALALLAAAAATRFNNLRWRMVFSGAIAALLAFLYFWRYPQLLQGPYGAVDSRLAELFFANLGEAAPIVGHNALAQTVRYLVPLLIGIAASGYFLRRTRGDGRYAWALLTALQAVAILLGTFYQVRVIIYADAFAIVALTAFVECAWAAIGHHYRGRRRFWAEIALIFVIGPLPVVFVPLVAESRTFNQGVLLFPAQLKRNDCSTYGIEGPLTLLSIFDDRQLRVLNMMDEGPALIFRSSYSIMAAPYHTNVGGNLDAHTFFATTDIEEAHRIALQDAVDVVVMCRYIPDMYLQGKGPFYVVTSDGAVHLPPNASFAGQLYAGRVPAWLKSMPSTPNYMIFKVRHP
ncbi:MAG: hypothetical protein P4M15_06505 [Alphaproteobacteria bacterium]|nr:hypothetical protein [Alphaproteobacteria bacterium]